MIEELTIKDLIDSGLKEFELKVSGVSMLPLLDENTRVIVHNVDPDNIKSGDIILFSSKDCSVIHRVMRRVERGGKLFFKEKGDNNSSMSIVESEKVIGKVVFVEGFKLPSLFSSKKNSYKLRLDSQLPRIFGLIFSFNDFIYKMQCSSIDRLIEIYSKNYFLMYSLLIPVSLILKIYRQIYLKLGKILFFLISEEVRQSQPENKNREI